MAETLFAPASGFGRAAVAVLRISGPEAGSTLDALCGPRPAPRRLSLRTVRDPEDGTVLDRALVAFFPGPETYSGEDMAELHLHGGLAVRARVLAALSRAPGCRAAGPGEFTRRAVLNGRMDLAEAEGVADLIDAETEGQRRQALRQLDGALSRQVATWRDEAIDLLAGAEAALDFSDEGDVDEASLDAGLIGRATALRDAIEVRLDLDGLPVVLVDTAGLRETDEVVEAEGIRRSRARIAQADLVLALVPPGGIAPDLGEAPALTVYTKADLPGAASVGLAVSAHTGEGLSALLGALRDRAEAGMGEGDALITRARHREALERCLGHLDRLCAGSGSGLPELAAEDLRLAVRALGEVGGHVGVEDVLERLFAGFCIGK